MAAPDEGAPFLYAPPEAVLDRGTHAKMAGLLHDHRERLTVEQAGRAGDTGAGGGSDVLDVVYLVACYYFARYRHVPDAERDWNRHACT
ncbi:hypothetical protein, partial [Streptomyces glaucescens]